MSFAFKRTYRGPLRLAVLDMAGTIADYGSCAPAGAFVALFAGNKVTVTQAQARGPMGLEKKDHIRTLAQLPDVAAQWREAHGSDWTETDIDRMYAEFIPIQVECLPRYAKLIPGALDAVTAMKGRGLTVAATSGYNREMIDVCLDGAKTQGLVPDLSVAASEVAGGRPAPWMIYHCMETAGVYPPESVVKIGDTVPDIDAGLNAGVWTVGLAKTGNMIGLNEEELAALDPADLKGRLEKARAELLAAGAHYVADGLADCGPVLDAIEAQIASSERP